MESEQRSVRLLVSNLTPLEVARLGAEASKVWSSLFPEQHARTHKRKRIDEGMRRRQRAPPQQTPRQQPTEKQFLERLRAQVGSRAASSSTACPSSLAPLGDVWGAGHEREKDFQEKKQNARLIEACLHSSLVIVIVAGLRSDLGLAPAGTYWAGACPGGTAVFREANLAGTLLPEEVNHDVNTKTQIEVRKRIASRAMRERAKERLHIKFKSPYPKHGPRQVRVVRQCRCALAGDVGCPTGESGAAGHAARFRGHNFRGC